MPATKFVRCSVTYLLVPVLMLFSCAREEILDDIQSERFQPQLVIHSLISPGDSIFINVGQMVSLGQSVETAKVTNAIVTLTDEQNNTIKLPLVEKNYYATIYGTSQQDFPIKAGATYTLSVTHPQLPTAQAICTVPINATQLQSVKYIGKSRVPDDGRLTFDVRVNWYDSDPYLNRVLFLASYTTVHPTNKSILREGTYNYQHDPFHGVEQTDSLFTYYYNFFSSETFYTDTLSDGTILSQEVLEAPTIYELTTYLITPDEHMALYQASLDFYAQNESALNSNSFIELYRGIIPEYSNVEGGLGVFGAYLRSEPVYLTLE